MLVTIIHYQMKQEEERFLKIIKILTLPRPHL